MRIALLFLTGLLAGSACGPAVPAGNPKAAESTATTSAPPSGAKCGRLASEPMEKIESPWGPHPQCDDLATIWGNVPHEDRACATDTDCVAHTSDGNCWNQALNAAASKKAAYKEYPCGNPASGACGGPVGGYHARCKSGCCVIAGE